MDFNQFKLSKRKAMIIWFTEEEHITGTYGSIARGERYLVQRGENFLRSIQVKREQVGSI